jgi:hypothetical protein
MRRLELVFLILCHGFLLNGQFIQNKLNVSLGGSLSLPLNPQTINKDHFNYPSLYGNYPAGLAGNFTIDYKFIQNIWIGIHLNELYYWMWYGDNNIFILEKPSLNLSTISFCGSYYPKKCQVFPNSVSWSILLAPEIVLQKLKWHGVIQEDNDEQLFPNKDVRLNYGIKAGISILHDINNVNGIRADIYYQYINVKSPYYIDKSFHSVNISLGFYFKFLKDRYYKYD